MFRFVRQEAFLLKNLVFITTMFFNSFALAEEQNVLLSGGQVSVPVGLTVQVKAVTVGSDATKVRLQASFDSHKTNFVNMNDQENAYISWGDGEQDRLHMRQIADNKWMRVVNGTTMEGDLIFPGVIPAGVTKIALVFNAGNSGDDTNAPGVTIPLELKK
ncbi:hypothetical protein EDE05_10282 [Neorhizobium sp. R1-B]|uniref:hypothetical protein n=1 Tax=Neorhizobium sp. R1-B TaxID=2485162 RepID=UPI0010646F57|nr:hypothetical protein [Neorhizobium sp. R1-B]TDX88110.1 hypothetical protein EDE05_10282 [Neorhizobium sp. R1-B]